MKKVIIISLLSLIALMVALPGCTEEEPGYIIVTDVESNPEVIIVDEHGHIVLIDEEARALATITFEHHILHEGTAYISDTVDLVMADGAILILVFKTMPAPERAHMFFEVTTLVGGDLKVWEGAIWNTGTGGLVPIYNRKRETTMISSGILEDLTATPAFTATNNIIEKPAGLNTAGATNIHHLFAWGKKEKFLAGNVREAEGFILKPDTQYAIVFTAEGAANKAQIILNWYEHEPH